MGKEEVGPNTISLLSTIPKEITLELKIVYDENTICLEDLIRGTESLLNNSDGIINYTIKEKRQ